MSKYSRRKELEGKTVVETTVKKKPKRRIVEFLDDGDNEVICEVTTVKKNEAGAELELEKVAADLRKQADLLYKEAEEKEKAAKKERERLELEKKQREEEIKKKELHERAAKHRRVFFTHNLDGSIDWQNPFLSANDAKFYDDNYVIVPSLVEDGRYVRPLSKEEASCF